MSNDVNVDDVPTEADDAVDVEQPDISPDDKKGEKRTFGEMATHDLSRVFFQTISKKLLIDAMPRVQALERRVERLRSRVQYYTSICPECVTDVHPDPDLLYCAECDRTLSCMDWKNEQQHVSCENHPERTFCSDCDITLCPECVTTCIISTDEYCETCLHDHAQTCQPCRLEYIM